MDIQESKEEISKKHEESVGTDAGLVIDDIEEVNAEQEEKSAEDKEVSVVASSSKKKETNVKERASKRLI